MLIAIDNENIELIQLLLEYEVELGDAVLYAIEEENVAAVELLLKAHEIRKQKRNDGKNNKVRAVNIE